MCYSKSCIHWLCWSLLMHVHHVDFFSCLWHIHTLAYINNYNSSWMQYSLVLVVWLCCIGVYIGIHVPSIQVHTTTSTKTGMHHSPMVEWCCYYKTGNERQLKMFPCIEKCFHLRSICSARLEIFPCMVRWTTILTSDPHYHDHRRAEMLLHGNEIDRRDCTNNDIPRHLAYIWLDWSNLYTCYRV